jgi:hypothetical protein
MESVEQIKIFCKVIKNDQRISTTHVSLYMALFLHWSLKHYQNPVSITRGEIMQLSKIGGKATYHKCIKELQEYGYIQYHPSFHPAYGSLVYLNIFIHDK